MSDEYFDAHGRQHVGHDHHLSQIWRILMKQHMDVCYDAGLDAGTSANLMINGAAYLLAAHFLDDPVSRKRYAQMMASVFLGKVEQAVDEVRNDQRSGNYGEPT